MYTHRHTRTHAHTHILVYNTYTLKHSQSHRIFSGNKYTENDTVQWRIFYISHIGSFFWFARTFQFMFAQRFHRCHDYSGTNEYWPISGDCLWIDIGELLFSHGLSINYVRTPFASNKQSSFINIVFQQVRLYIQTVTQCVIIELK